MIQFNDNMKIAAPKPIDTRMTVADATEMNAIASSVLYYGLMTYRLDEQKFYIYKSDDAWHVFDVSGAIDPVVQAHLDNTGIHVTQAQSDGLDASVNPGTANRYATLGDLTVYGLTQVVETVADMVALTGITEGDRAIVWNNTSDPSKNGEWISTIDNPAVEADWLHLPNQSAVTSVAGKTGAVVLVKADITDLTDTTVDSVEHNNANTGAIPDGSAWVYDAANAEMKLTLVKSGVLSSAITSTITIGGIVEGQTFPIGTPMEDIWYALLNKKTLDYFTFTASHGTSSILETGTATNITVFDYTHKGNPTDLTIEDSQGTMGVVSVSGTQYTPPSPDTYNYNSYTKVIWYLKSPTSTPTQLTKSLLWVAPTYYGTNAATSGFPTTVAEIEAGIKSVVDTQHSVTVSNIAASEEYFWIAVEDTQSDAYTEWDASSATNPYNKGVIASDSLVTPAQTITDGVITYKLYKSGYATDLSIPITLT